MNSEPIPGPFRAENGTIKALTHGEWYTVATVERKKFTSEGRVEIAAFLAQACNSHEAMLELLQDVGNWLQVGLWRGEINRGTANRGGDLVSQIRAAIAKAKGEG